MPMPKSEKRTDAQRRAGQKYNASHYATLAAGVKRELSDAFRVKCTESGLTVGGALTAFVRALVADSPAALEIVSQAARAADGGDDGDGDRARG